jgi:acetylornithine/succinyldiaminopimelate/putrescine aminotransferase
MSQSDTLPTMVRGEGSTLHDRDGRAWLDLGISFGSVFLGHGHPGVTATLQEQAARVMATGRYPGGREETVDRLLAAVLPPGVRPGALLSTGMEAAELALRIAATQTGRTEFAGFARSMHGKSAMTAALCWDNAPLRPDGVHLLPYLDTMDEDGVMKALRRCLEGGRIAALLVEPIQGSNGGHEASAQFRAEAMALCRQHGTLFIMDEILTGLYRTGPAFCSSALPAPPDLLLFAKCMGNGFPVSAVGVGPGVQITPRALPGSTFAGNPLARAVVQATLEAMAQLPMTRQVQQLDGAARRHLEPLRTAGVAVRGRGALWCLDLGPGSDMTLVAARLRDAGLLVTINGTVLRLLPAATIPAEAWLQACDQVGQACLAARKRTQP